MTLKCVHLNNFSNAGASETDKVLERTGQYPVSAVSQGGQ